MFELGAFWTPGKLASHEAASGIGGDGVRAVRFEGGLRFERRTIQLEKSV